MHPYQTWYEHPDQMGAGSMHLGNLMLITHRWHDLCKPGHYMVTFVWSDWGQNFHAVMDDFGELVQVNPQ